MTDTAATLATLDALEGARRLALGWLDAFAAARARLLAEPHDVEALHDLRVAQRRLRETLRTFRPEIDPGLRRRDWKHLRAIGRRTNALRDADVRRAWLTAHRDALPEDARADADRWLDAHAPDAGAGTGTDAATADPARDARIARVLARHADPHIARWHRRLARYVVTRTVGEPQHLPPFAAVVAERLARAGARTLARFADAAAAPEPAGEQHALHRARIALKRVRALIAPWREADPALETLFGEATALQDALGAMRDAAAFAGDVREELPALSAALADVAERAHADARTLRDASLRDGRWPALDAAIAALHALPATVGAPGVEIERKFLLRALPAAIRDEPATHIMQGWLPGEQLRERLRRAVAPDGTVRWWRTVKLGRGVARIEVEEATDPALFESLWPLTARRRVDKRRRAVRDGELVWEIDEFLDRDLVLAEVELPTADTPCDPPAWLAPYVEREVTDDPAYVNAALARPVTIPGLAPAGA